MLLHMIFSMLQCVYERLHVREMFSIKARNILTIFISLRCHMQASVFAKVFNRIRSDFIEKKLSSLSLVCNRYFQGFIN